MLYFYHEEKRYIDYAIVFLLLALCLLKGLSNVQSLFPQPNSDWLIIYQQEQDDRETQK